MLSSLIFALLGFLAGNLPKFASIITWLVLRRYWWMRIALSPTLTFTNAILTLMNIMILSIYILK